MPTPRTPRLLRQVALLSLVVTGLSADAANAANAVADTTRPLLLVANKADQTLGVIDPAAGKQVAAISEDATTGHEVAASPDGRRAFVPIYGNAGVGRLGTDGSLIRVIDLAQQAIVATFDFGHGVRPHCPVFGPKDGLLYVTTELDESVTVIDPATLKIVGTVPTGQKESHMLAIARDGRRGYTANVGPGTVSVLDLVERKLVKVIPISAHTQRIALSVDDRFAFTTDQREPRVAVIDTATNEVARWITLPGIGFCPTVTPDGRGLLVTSPSHQALFVVDLATGEVTHTINLPRLPQEVIVRPDGATAYVSCDIERKVAEIDLRTMTVARLIDAGPGADGLAWADAR